MRLQERRPDRLLKAPRPPAPARRAHVGMASLWSSLRWPVFSIWDSVWAYDSQPHQTSINSSSHCGHSWSSSAESRQEALCGTLSRTFPRTCQVLLGGTSSSWLAVVSSFLCDSNKRQGRFQSLKHAAVPELAVLCGAAWCFYVYCFIQFCRSFCRPLPGKAFLYSRPQESWPAFSTVLWLLCCNQSAALESEAGADPRSSGIVNRRDALISKAGNRMFRGSGYRRTKCFGSFLAFSEDRGVSTMGTSWKDAFASGGLVVKSVAVSERVGISNLVSSCYRA